MPFQSIICKLWKNNKIFCDHFKLDSWLGWKCVMAGKFWSRFISNVMRGSNWRQEILHALQEISPYCCNVLLCVWLRTLWEEDSSFQNCQFRFQSCLWALWKDKSYFWQVLILAKSWSVGEDYHLYQGGICNSSQATSLCVVLWSRLFSSWSVI